jgi:hypothetical protein
MHQIYRCFLSLLLTTQLVGCAVISAAEVAVLVLSLPVPAKTGMVKLAGYSLGPVSSQEATDLLMEAIPPDEGTVYFTGRVEWTGLSRLKQSVGELYQSMGAITDFNILLLWWSESNERYEVLIRLPFAEIYSIELWTPGFGTAIRFCLETDEIPVGDEVLGIERRSTLRVMKRGVFIDAEKTEEIFKLLDSKLKTKTKSQGQPNPCDEVPVSGEEWPKGFGNCDPANEDC